MLTKHAFMFFITLLAEVQHCAGRAQGWVEHCYLPRTLLEKKIVVPTCQSELFCDQLVLLGVFGLVLDNTICSRFGICNRGKSAAMEGWDMVGKE